MIDLFPGFKQSSSEQEKQGKLLSLAILIIIMLALILTLSPIVRYHGEAGGVRYDHWLGVIVWIASFAILHYQSYRKLPHHDPFILPVVALLTGIGLMTIWRLYPNMGLRQTIWIALASLIVFIGLNYPVFMNYLRRYKYILLISGLFLIGLTFFLGINPSGNGPTLWLEFLGIHFQPSEVLKILIIAYLASFFADRMVVVQKKFAILLPTLLVISAVLVLLVIQRDLGAAIIFLLIYLGIIFSTRSEKILFWLIPILVLSFFLIGYIYIDVVRVRVDAWINPFGDPSGASYQILQSIIAIAEGKIVGSGIGLGSPSLIPVSVSDFIFSSIVEELGFLGGSLIIFLFIILIYRGIKIVSITPHSFDRYLTLGLIFYFGVQSILIIAGNIGLLPLTGVTLPFISYGGSSLVISFIAVLFLLINSSRAQSNRQPQKDHLSRPVLFSSMMILILCLEMITTSLESFWFQPSLVSRPENPRWVIDDRFSPRGEILDRENKVIIANTGQIGSFQRQSNHIPLNPVIGYTNATYGQTGIELSMYDYLRGYQGYPGMRIFWHELLYNQPPKGLDVRLTIDLDLQKTADHLLGEEKGAIILMNAQSGEILIMASHPYFDAENLEENWDNLISNEDAPLVNRATQGTYPPGATLFPFVAATQAALLQGTDNPQSILEGSPGLETCASFPGRDLTWQSVISNGCQIMQAKLAEMSGENILLALFQNLNFFTPPEINLNVAQVDSPDIDNPDDFFLGQGAFNITPLQLALAASALTNQGILPAPRIINAYQDPQGNWVTIPKLGQNVQAIEVESAEWVNNLLITPDSPYWQVTSIVSTSENPQVTWFMGGTTLEWQGQPTTVVVLLENDAPQLAEEIGITLLEETIQSP